MAAAADVAIADVKISKTRPSTSGVNVHVSMKAADEESGMALVQRLTIDNLSEELTNRGLPQASFVQA